MNILENIILEKSAQQKVVRHSKLRIVYLFEAPWESIHDIIFDLKIQL
jgi:hypothetical protein